MSHNKVRFDGLDVTAMVAHLQHRRHSSSSSSSNNDGSVLGQRVVNLYDDAAVGGGDSATFYIKLENKTFLVLEAGIRFHTTTRYDAGSSGGSGSHNMPSPFCAKLRKHIRGLRLENIVQLGQGERVVLFEFGVGAAKQALILELYSKGNLILVDGNTYCIQALWRSHTYTNENKKNENNDDNDQEHQVKVQVGHVYPVTYATSWNASTTNTHTRSSTTDNGDNKTDDTHHHHHQQQQQRQGFLAMTTAEECFEWIQNRINESLQKQQQQDTKSNKKKKKNKTKSTRYMTLKTLLLHPSSGVSQYGPALLEHCILFAELPPHQPIAAKKDENHDDDDHVSNVCVMDQIKCQAMLDSIQHEGSRVMQALQQEGGEQPGYILYREKKSREADHDNNNNTDPSLLPSHADKILEEFQPHLLKQHTNRLYLQYDNFAAAVDDFFAHLVHQKQWLKAQAAEAAARHKLDKIKHDQQARLAGLEIEQEHMRMAAAAVQQHADDVEKALTVINSALDSGMDWEQLEEVVTVEQQKENPIALLIHKLELSDDAMTLRLPVYGEDGEEHLLNVKILLKETAHANANRLFAKYKASKEKAQKTIEASTKALKAAEETALRQLEEAKNKSRTALTVGKRKPAWFEKFRWFITTDNYLVLGGRDAQQNEQLVKRYLRPGDAYMHADVQGAASCILRAKRRRLPNGKTETVPLSERALREAGNFTVCHSSAWSKKVVMSAWWVEADQVSKTAPTGEYLTVGSFMIRGKKNFLPPCQLEMGLAVLFRLGDDNSIARHLKDRRDFTLMELENADETPEGNNFVKVESAIRSLSTNEQEPVAESQNGSSGEPSPHHIATEENAADPSENLSESQQISFSVASNGAKQKTHSTKQKNSSTRQGKKELPSQKQAADNNGDFDLGKMKRGRKAKMKRAKKKYEDQDDEEKELAMLALQGGEKSKKKKGGKRNQVPSTAVHEQLAADTVALLVKDSKTLAVALPDEAQSILAECVTVVLNDEHNEVRWDKFDGTTLEQLASLSTDAQIAAAKRLLTLKHSTRIDNFSASLGGIIRTIQKYGHENLGEEANGVDGGKRKTKAEKEENDLKWKQTMAEEGIVDGDIDEDAVDDTVELNKLTGKPHADDLILGAVAVCAPYSTISQYTYRIKLTPGSMKRGKASKQCVEMFLRDDFGKTITNHDRYKELIKRVSDNEWLQAICADVKLSAPGASKIAKKSKAAGKKAKNKR